MSRVGRAPIAVPAGVQVHIELQEVRVKGPHGEMQETLPPMVRAELKEGKVVLSMDPQLLRKHKALYGTARARVANLVQGVHSGFT